MGSETLHIIYYLSREGMVEEPHLLEIPLPACSGGSLHLIDVKRWLMLIRGNNMPASFSWSFKRHYKEGCIWQDLSTDEDLILPSSEGEYILKGSEFVVAPKEAQWPTLACAKEKPDLTTPFRTKDDGIGLIGDAKQMNTEITDGEGSCSLALSDHSQKSDILNDTEHIHVDHSTMDSSCVIDNNRVLINSNVVNPQSSTHEVEEDSKEKREIKLHRNIEGNTAHAPLHDQPLTLSTAMVLQATHLASDTYKKLSIAGKASSHQVVENCTICRPPLGDTSSNANSVLMPRITSKTLGYKTNVCDVHSCETEELQTQACPYAASTVDKDIYYKTDVCDLHPAVTAELQTQGPCTENQQLSRSKSLKSKSSLNPLHWASCMAQDIDVIDIQGEPLIDTQRSIKMKWGCSHTPVVLSHVKVNSVGNTSACKPPVPSSIKSNNHILKGITSEVQSHDKRVCSKRATYSDQLGVKLPATMPISNVTGQKSSPMSSQQRLALRKMTVHEPPYRHKNATPEFSQKKTSLPVFGSEKQHQHPSEELDCLAINSTRNVSVRALQPPHCFYTHQDFKFSTPYHHKCGKFQCRHHQDYAKLRQDGAHLNTKMLWEELLQTTRRVFTSQETI